MKPEYKHQCRYCAHCVCGDAWWCDLKSEYCHMAEVRGECLWAEACFGDADALMKFNDKEKIK